MLLYMYVYKTKCTILTRAFLEHMYNGQFDHWFSSTKAFLCSIWNLCQEKLYPLHSSNQLMHGQWQIDEQCYGSTFRRYLLVNQETFSKPRPDYSTCTCTHVIICASASHHLHCTCKMFIYTYMYLYMYTLYILPCAPCPSLSIF